MVRECLWRSALWCPKLRARVGRLWCIGLSGVELWLAAFWRMVRIGWAQLGTQPEMSVSVTTGGTQSGRSTALPGFVPIY